MAAGLASCSGGNDNEPVAQPPASATVVPTTTTTTATTATTTATSRQPGEAPDPRPAPTGPVYALDFPDPFVLTVDGGYLAFGTEAGLVKVQRLGSRDLHGWDRLGDALPEVPQWAAPHSTWAPSVLERSGGYVLYFAALVAGSDRHCIGAAVAPQPDGPYRPMAEPLVCPLELGGAIDPSPFVDSDGEAWLLWKNDGVTRRRESAIWSQPLAGDGRSVAGDAVRLISTDQPWEHPHVEAPSLTRIADTYWLAYSGAWWNQAAYGVGLARCDSPTGPCTKPFDHAVLHTRPGAEGPGGLEWFEDVDGRLTAAFHAWPAEPGYPGARSLWIAPVDTTGDAPVIRSG